MAVGAKQVAAFDGICPGFDGAEFESASVSQTGSTESSLNSLFRSRRASVMSTSGKKSRLPRRTPSVIDISVHLTFSNLCNRQHCSG